MTTILIAQMFGISKPTVGDMEKNKDEILKFLHLTKRDPGARKTLKKSENPF